MLGSLKLYIIAGGALAVAALVLLWQVERGERQRLDRANRDMAARIEQAALAREVAEAYARRMEQERKKYQDALKTLANEEIPDADLDPGIVAALCSVRPDDPVCAR